MEKEGRKLHPAEFDHIEVGDPEEYVNMPMGVNLPSGPLIGRIFPKRGRDRVVRFFVDTAWEGYTVKLSDEPWGTFEAALGALLDAYGAHLKREAARLEKALHELSSRK